MKKFISILTIVLLSNVSKAQMIKLIDFIQVKDDSISITWSAKVKFYSSEDKDNRLNLVKAELEKNYQIKPDRIIFIEEFMGKKYLTYLYSVKVKKDIPKKGTDINTLWNAIRTMDEESFKLHMSKLIVD